VRIHSANGSGTIRPRAISIIRGEIIHDLSDIRIFDRRAIDLDHLGHFRRPEILLEFFAARLRPDVIGGVTGGAIVLLPSLSRTAFSGTPRQRALLIAPLPSWPPATRGLEKPRLLPEH